MKLGIYLIALFLFLSGCVSVNSVWKQTRETDSIEAYQEFIQAYPESKYVADANLRLAQIGWDGAQKVNTVEAYQDFLERFPESKFSIGARGKLEELLWINAVQKDTEESFAVFLEAYPDSQHGEEAAARIGTLGRNAFVSNAKAGRLDSVKRNVGSVDIDQRSRALMMAVWGALHTYADSGFVDGKMVAVARRTAPADRKVYVEMVQLLLKSGADPELYNYEYFDSVAVSRSKLDKNFEEMRAHSVGERATMITKPSGEAEVELVPGGDGMSARKVAKIEKAKDIMTLLGKKK